MPNKTLPRISVIIGVLNMKEYLHLALDSVIKQNYPNLELIIMDGCSTDGTLDVIKQYESHITVWKSEKDKGHCDACNRAIDFATGEFITLLNADDILGFDVFNKVAAAYNKNPQAKMITTGVQILKKHPETSDYYVVQDITDADKLQLTLKNMLFELPVINARFFHKDLFTQFGKFLATHPDGSYNLSNDRDYLINLALAGVKTEIIPEPLYLYLSHDDSLTFGQKNVIKSRVEHVKLANKFLAKKNLSQADRDLIASWIINESVYLCLIYLSQKKIKSALEVMKVGVLKYHLRWLGKLGCVATRGVWKRIRNKLIHPSRVR